MSLSQLAYAYLLWQVPITAAAIVVRLMARRGTRAWQLHLARAIWISAVLGFPLCYLFSHLTPERYGAESTPEPRGTAQIVETQIPSYLSTAMRPVPVNSQASGLDGLEVLALLVALASGLRGLRVLRSEFALRGMYRRSSRYRTFPGLEVRVSSEIAAPLAMNLGSKRVVLLDALTAKDLSIVRIALLHEIQHHRQHDPYFAKILAWASVVYIVNPCSWGLSGSFELMEEQACDHRLLSKPQVEKKAYCRMLLEVATNSLRASSEFACANTRGLTKQKSMLQTRIESMMETKIQYPRRTVLLGAGIGSMTIFASSWKLGRWGAQAATLPADLGKYLNTSDPYGFYLPDSIALREVIHQKLQSSWFRGYIKKALDNYPSHGPYIEQQLAARGMPSGLLAVAMLESALDPLAANTPRPPELDLAFAKGLWQFIPTTGRIYGLVVNTDLDERGDVVKSTAAALDFLGDLHQRFGDWTLAIAAYNVGPEKVESAIAKGKTRDLAELVTKGLLNRYGLVVLAEMVIVNHQELFALEL